MLFAGRSKGEVIRKDGTGMTMIFTDRIAYKPCTLRFIEGATISTIDIWNKGWNDQFWKIRIKV